MNATDYAGNRARLAARLSPGSVAVIHANDIMPSNADGTLRFRQNNDLYWLSGILQDETALLLFPDHPDPNYREILFIKQVNEDFVKWHGRRHSLQEAQAISGIARVAWFSDFEQLFYEAAVQATHIYLNAIEHPRAVNSVETRDDRFARWCRKRFGLHSYKRLAPELAMLRRVKSEAELELIRKACNISGAGFRRLLRFIKPGVAERRAEAELIYEYMQHDGAWADYEPIVASGADSCILHYTSNHKRCAAGDVVLIDAAASYRLYNADLTRVLPVNGRFSPRQLQVYNAVWRVQQQLMDFIKAGRYLEEIQAHNQTLLIGELLGLGLFSQSDLERQGRAYYLGLYCYHGFGHLLGLDVHDVGSRYEPLPENSVLTVEPGIYIREEGIGIRLENNVQVTAAGVTDLMAGIPIDPAEIEALMQEVL
ncbi:aminopeptidase P family protein [Taibaiella chishuiensis]|uniref:Xaa-Pro aminopeptidase n=1 Tax=Taibaiella chishuiensis TaxID=1434707 RepID=A0A2P8D068_9BACT|nr:aminopeptidase P family protein [Taibaiella chishuiensis]PSK90615.1 aminopeptidase P [Taibaiella chishuiensis]